MLLVLAGMQSHFYGREGSRPPSIEITALPASIAWYRTAGIEAERIENAGIGYQKQILSAYFRY